MKKQVRMRPAREVTEFLGKLEIDFIRQQAVVVLFEEHEVRSFDNDGKEVMKMELDQRNPTDIIVFSGKDFTKLTDRLDDPNESILDMVNTIRG